MQQAPLQSQPETRSKAPLVVASIVAVLALGALLVWIFKPSILFGGGSMEAHYTELERHRAQQRETLGQQPASDAAPAPADPNANVAANSPAADALPGASAKTGRTYWTDFRGPARDGRYEEMTINTAWPAEGLRALWKQPVGGGYASFVVAEGVAFTIEQRRAKEVVAAYNIETGRELWIHSYDAEFRESNGDGPRATPTWHEGRVYSLGAMGDLRVLDGKTGNLVWSKNILSDNGASNLAWGMSASPLVVDDKVIVIAGGPSNKSVVAYNRQTGARVWGSLGDAASYTSPMLVTLAGRRQILAVTGSRVVGLAVEDGALLWEVGWTTSYGVNSAQPIVVDANRFIISAGYGHGAAMIGVARSGNGLSAQKVWENSFMKNKFNSSVLHNGNLYGLDEGILACIDASTGERKWKGGRYGYGQLVLASGHLVLISEDGDLVLVKATPDKHEEVARFQALDGKTWNHPAIANGRLLVRNQTQMACFDLSGR